MSNKIKFNIWLKSKLKFILIFTHLPNININRYKKYIYYFIIALLIIIDAKSISILIIIYNRSHNIYLLFYFIFILLKIIIQNIKLIYKTRTVNTGFSIRFFFFIIKLNKPIIYFF